MEFNNIMKPEVKAYLHPNPPLDGGTITNLWGNTYELKNRPFLEVELFNFAPGKYAIEVLHPVKIKKNVDIDSRSAIVYLYHDEFVNHKLSEVDILISGEGYEGRFTLPLTVHKISGRVKDFEGNPFPSFLWATKEEDIGFKSIIKTDRDGKFVFYYPEGKKLRLFVDDKSYSKTTFECWVIANIVKSDLEINPRVGNFELYDLQVWFTLGLCFAFFIPASLPLYMREKESGWKQHYPPILTKEDRISILINNKNAEIKEITEIPVDRKDYYPSYVVVAKSEQEKLTFPTIVKVEVNSPDKGRGEAWYVLYR